MGRFGVLSLSEGNEKPAKYMEINNGVQRVQMMLFISGLTKTGVALSKVELEGRA